MPARHCEKLEMAGEVGAGQEWTAKLGEGWVFRVTPIQPAESGYSGWDLVVDRETPAGFPDALFLATPPYDSINEREIGTTFGVRAQDAIGWNPRSFHVVTDPARFREGQRHFQEMPGRRQADAAGTGEKVGPPRAPGAAENADRWTSELLRGSSPGQLRILDARLTPGIADAAPFAENWALASAKTAHTTEPAAGGKATALGTLNWIRFAITLWLPGGWKAPPGSDSTVHSSSAACPE